MDVAERRVSSSQGSDPTERHSDQHGVGRAQAGRPFEDLESAREVVFVGEDERRESQRMLAGPGRGPCTGLPLEQTSVTSWPTSTVVRARTRPPPVHMNGRRVHPVGPRHQKTSTLLADLDSTRTDRSADSRSSTSASGGATDLDMTVDLGHRCGAVVGLAGIEPATSASSVQWSVVVSQALNRTYAVSDLRFPPVVTHT